jgi:putative restriction endonuclease
VSVWLKTVTRSWADVVEKLSSPEEVILWHADVRRPWHGPKLGDLVLFRPEDRERDIVGYGRVVDTTCHSAKDAWLLFGFGLGVWSEEVLFTQIQSRRGGFASSDPIIATTIVAWPVFFPPLNPFELPAAFPTNETAVPLCPAKGKRGRILLVSLRYHAGRTHGAEEKAQERLLGLKTHRVPGTSLRLGSKANSSIIAKLYGHRCAISGERVPITQDAAHIRPREYGGGDYLGNLMLLEVHLHRLWDRGLIGVDEQHRVMVSTQLQLFGSSDYLKYAGKPLRKRLLGVPYPDDISLRWHRKQLFKGPKVEP